ncbi:MAG: hypothetical protein A2667_01705 [Candidatus Wildermuthbacteria bacterium RIFCSPHIGHO2_01_FULL_47_27]|uniref:Uncharacterized protein n=2 Tax=Candidatus Wildermuthiibacteriota TaxID=1817923 RepID=A0A1G2RQX3_9BACT|nr:MAG: hypothetical protein A2667_01705 [Candidatus Wildermuthbacteria bacterium RIFCSPHIGHO2_01_FULL_47_27]OHA68191.1 MAG: hypothetical protein A3D59_02980 [Candidatus Wildermuthbacteria bacterium RIFCSPHIGHO2_02_FULL_47_17]OHA75275.1 MAG: hypothetical protein A3A32_03900 [Candidatus Wildermuthbacteria bacterium RIFCSPLOWO2_01_FULL_48_35]OHA76261.1 MAG: hypothetical protein A3I38_01085 [Candidatus Wildermuthbacteria bacterium RIFCSPLOWO2_02_FULL_47_10]
MWLKILGGFGIVILRPEGGIALWRAQEVPMWQSYLIVLFWTSATLLITYYGTALLVAKIKRAVLSGILARWYRRSWFHQLNKNGRDAKRKIFFRLMKQKTWLLVLLAFLPYQPIPFFNSALIIAVKTLDIRWGLLILAGGNAFRWFIVTIAIYKLDIASVL